MVNKIIPLWNRDENEFNPTLTTYLLDDCLMETAFPSNQISPRSRGAVLICPGGGYGGCSKREGEPIALSFLAAGYHAFVLEYTTKWSDKNMKHPRPLLDVSRAMTIIRENAKEWNIDTDKIVICGFSAGGHLAASLGTLGNRCYVKNNPEIGDNLPNALILCYSVISSGEFAHRGSFINLLGENATDEQLFELSLEKQVSNITPPSFIWHTADDEPVPVENSMLFASALRQQNIPFELHIFPKGVHGLSLANAETAPEECHINPNVQPWIKLCITWLNELFGK